MGINDQTYPDLLRRIESLKKEVENLHRENKKLQADLEWERHKNYHDNRSRGW